MGFNTQIVRIATAPPGWHNVFLLDAAPWYFLEPIALWADVQAWGGPGPGAEDPPETIPMGLSGTYEIRVPEAPSWSVSESGYYGAIHDDEIFNSARAEWAFEAQFRVDNRDLSLMQTVVAGSAEDETEPTSGRFGVERLGRLLPAAHSTPGRDLKLLQRVPASPGWFNVYLLDAEPWYLLRAVALWMLVRTAKTHLSRLGALLHLESRFERPCVMGCDGRLDFPAAGGSVGFLEMTHRSVITPGAVGRWAGIAKATRKQDPSGQGGVPVRG